LEANGDGVALVVIRMTVRFFKASIVAGAVGIVSYLLLALFLYWLFRRTHVVAVSVLFVLVASSVPVTFAAFSRQMDILSLLNTWTSLGSIDQNQLKIQFALALRGYDNGILLSSFFWGLWLFPLGWIMWQARMGVPRVLGVLLMFGGIAYVFHFAGELLIDNYKEIHFLHLVLWSSAICSMIGEVGTILWLLITGAKAWPQGSTIRELAT